MRSGAEKFAFFLTGRNKKIIKICISVLGFPMAGKKVVADQF